MLLVFVWMIVVLLFLFILLSKIAKKRVNNEQKLVYECDNVFYHIAASQYKVWLKAEDTKLQDKHLSVIKRLFESKNPNYISNIELIKSSVKSIEKEIWKKITHKNIWDNIDLCVSKMKKLALWSKILKLITILIVIMLVGGMIYGF